METFSKYLKNDIVLIQEFMDANIHAGKPMTGPHIYEGVKAKLSSEINELTFKSSLSANVKEGNITGFKGVRGRYGGYVKTTGDEVQDEEDLDSQTDCTDEPDSTPKQSEKDNDKFIVMITNSFRIIHMDKRNFCVQNLKSNLWHTESYNSNLLEAVKAAEKLVTKYKLRQYPGEYSLKDMKAFLEEMKSDIFNEITVKIGELNLSAQQLPEVEIDEPVDEQEEVA